MIETLFGATWGLLIRIHANQLGKQRAFARPWNHVLWVGIGSYVGYNWNRWGVDLLKQVNEKRKAVGLIEISREKTY